MAAHKLALIALLATSLSGCIVAAAVPVPASSTSSTTNSCTNTVQSSDYSGTRTTTTAYAC